MLYKYLFVNTKKNPELAIKAKNKFPNFVFLNTIMKWVITYLMAVYLIMY